MQLVDEIRSLESELEYLHQEASRFETEAKMWKDAFEAHEVGQDGALDTSGSGGMGGLQLPERHMYATDLLNMEGAEDLVVCVVVDGALEAVIHGLADLNEQAKVVPILEEQLAVLDAKSAAAMDEVCECVCVCAHVHSHECAHQHAH